MDDEADEKYRIMMGRIAQVIKKDELENMKFFCKKIVPEKVQQNIKLPVDLWKELENRGKLGPCNLSFLEKLLTSCLYGRTDCLELMREYKVELTSSLPSSTVTSTISLTRTDVDTTPERKHVYRGPDLQRELTFLSKNLGHDWKFFVRSLGLSEPDLEMVVESHPTNVKEQMMKALWSWLYEVQEKASKDKLISALRDIGRNDLAHKLVKDSY